MPKTGPEGMLEAMLKGTGVAATTEGAAAAPAGNWLSQLLGKGSKALKLNAAGKALGPLFILELLMGPLKGGIEDIQQQQQWRGLSGDLDESRKFFHEGITNDEVEQARYQRNMRSIERLAMSSPDTLDSLHALMTDSAVPRLTSSELRVGGVAAMDRDELNKALAQGTMMDRIRAV